MKTRMFSCSHENCFRTFRDENSLKIHLDFHEKNRKFDPKKFTCIKCNKSLSTKQSLKDHLHTHSKKKSFRCLVDGCGKVFRQCSQLCNHRKVHKEAKKMMNQEIETLKISMETTQPIVNDVNSMIVLPPIQPKSFDIKLPMFN